MKKYQILLVFIFGLVYTIKSYYDYESVRKEHKSFLSDINISIINIKQRVIFNPDIITDANFTFWDMDESFILKNRKAKKFTEIQKNNTNSQKDKDIDVDVNNRIICLEKECWEFLGVITINDKVIVTLLSQGENVQLKTFNVNDMLLENIMIIGIREDSLFLKDIKKNKKFTLKLFEVDVNKYIPKKSIKEKNEENKL